MMPDFEKVIMGLSRHGNSDCEYDKETMCPYWGESHCSSRLCLDAIALLKAQEPIKPIRKVIGCGWSYFCGKCGNSMVPQQHFCKECGQAVKWDG